MVSRIGTLDSRLGPQPLRIWGNQDNGGKGRSKMKANWRIVGCLLVGLVLLMSLSEAFGAVEYLTPGGRLAPWRFSTSVWAGERRRIGSTIHVAATLVISEASNGAFTFEILASSGAHTGQIESAAKIVGPNRAIFIDEDRCQLTFHLKGAAVKIETTTGCQWYAGVGVHFAGEYRANVKIIRSTLMDKGIFQTEGQEEAFQRLVGNDYELFLQNTHLVFATEDLDGFGAKVYEVGVRGLFTMMEAIYVIGPKGRLWAAVIDEDTVKVYTNEKSHPTRLPRTIERWLSKLPARRLVFMPSPQH